MLERSIRHAWKAWSRSIASGRLNRRCAWNKDTPDVTVDRHRVGLEWILRRATQHGAGPHVELRAVQRARHRRAVDGAFTQRTLSVRAHGLRRTETSFDVEHRHIT